MTKLGIALRKIRLEKQELLKDMASKLNVSSAFLSAIETGKKKIPANFVDKVCEAYGLTDNERVELSHAADMSTQEMRISLEGASPAQHQVALSFAKALNGLTDDDISEIMRVFEKRNKKRGGNH